MKARQLIGAVLGSVIKIVILIIVVMGVYRGAIIAYDYGYRVFMEPAISAGEGRSITVAVTEDMNALEIGELFQSKGLIRDARLFLVQYYASEFRSDVKPGIFELSTSMTVEEMMSAMAKASVQEEE